MTTNEQPAPLDPRAALALMIDDADMLADLLLEADDVDVPTVAAIFERALPAPMFVRFCDKVEICPVHICDVAICRDDSYDCHYVN